MMNFDYIEKYKAVSESNKEFSIRYKGEVICFISSKAEVDRLFKAIKQSQEIYKQKFVEEYKEELKEEVKKEFYESFKTKPTIKTRSLSEDPTFKSGYYQGIKDALKLKE